MIEFSLRTLREFADPLSWRKSTGHSLHEALSPLRTLGHCTLQCRMEEARLRRALDDLDEFETCGSYEEFHEVRDWEALPLSDARSMRAVLAEYAKRFPAQWVWLVGLTHLACHHALRHLPLLFEGIEELIRIEGALHYSSSHPNRDHVVHLLGDAFLASENRPRPREGHAGGLEAPGRLLGSRMGSSADQSGFGGLPRRAGAYRGPSCRSLLGRPFP